MVTITINNNLLKFFAVICFIILGIVLIKGAPLPTVGGDSNIWGTILNAYLQTQHDSNGSHTNITATGINVTGDFLVNNASGDKAMSTDADGNLNLSRGVILGNYATKPSCVAGYLGMMVFDTANNKPYVCASASTWKPLDSDYDSDGLIDWLDNNDALAAVLNATSAVVRTGYTFVNNSGVNNGSLANCASEGSQSCYSTGSYYSATACSGTSGDQICYAGASGEWHDNECSDSTTTTISECYVDDTAKYVGTNACSAGNSTGYCYMNAATLQGIDGDFSASNIKNGITIFGVAGTSKILCRGYNSAVCYTDWCTLGEACSNNCDNGSEFISFGTSGASSFSIYCRTSTGSAFTCYVECTH